MGMLFFGFFVFVSFQTYSILFPVHIVATEKTPSSGEPARSPKLDAWIEAWLAASPRRDAIASASSPYPVFIISAQGGGTEVFRSHHLAP
jgi:hypothetical protein